MRIPLLTLSLWLTGALTAQSTSLTLQTPLTAQVTNNGQNMTSTIAPGPLPAVGAASQANSVSLASISWDTSIEPTGIYAYLTTQAYVNAPGATASIAGFDVIYYLSNPTPIAVDLRLRRDSLLTGTPFQIDVSNDGSAELSNSTASGDVTLTLTIGPTPLPIRAVSSASLSTPGQIGSLVSITATPTAGYYFTQVVQSCVSSHLLVALPRFDSGLRLRVLMPLLGGYPSVIVLGTNMQPTLLPTTTGFPCLLVPSPDVTVFPGNLPYDLNLPASARPFMFWAQAVVVTPNELRTTNGIRVIGT
tara:strand:- start:4228 stop:5139 length:912 start_codon:yes stop_codon:yes gene_type:complete